MLALCLSFFKQHGVILKHKNPCEPRMVSLLLCMPRMSWWKGLDAPGGLHGNASKGKDCAKRIEASSEQSRRPFSSGFQVKVTPEAPKAADRKLKETLGSEIGCLDFWDALICSQHRLLASTIFNFFNLKSFSHGGFWSDLTAVQFKIWGWDRCQRTRPKKIKPQPVTFPVESRSATGFIWTGIQIPLVPVPVSLSPLSWSIWL